MPPSFANKGNFKPVFPRRKKFRGYPLSLPMTPMICASYEGGNRTSTTRNRTNFLRAPANLHFARAGLGLAVDIPDLSEMALWRQSYLKHANAATHASPCTDKLQRGSTEGEREPALGAPPHAYGSRCTPWVRSGPSNEVGEQGRQYFTLPGRRDGAAPEL